MTEASLKDVAEWMVAFLQAGDGATATLRECMEFGHSDMKLLVTDSTGTEHRLGDTVYEDAHLVTLWQLVTAGDVEPVFENDGQRAAWERWMNGVPLDQDSRGPVLKIPLRYARQSQHVEEEPIPAQLAGEHLLCLLKAEGAVLYHIFYDDTTETEVRLHKEFHLRHEDESAAILMDDVVWQLQQAGLVTKTDLKEKLSDGSYDYRIELTPEGRVFVDGGKKFTFRHVQLL